MFLSSMFLGIPNVDPDQERDPPAPATPVTFPATRPRASNAWSDPSSPPKLEPLFAKISGPSSVSDDHLCILNVHASSDCAPQDLLPLRRDGRSYFPPLQMEPFPEGQGSKHAMRTAFETQLAEVQLDNDTAIRALTRTTKPGGIKPRLSYMRKFWEGAESVASYWDTSADQYYEAPLSGGKSDGDENDAKRQRMDSEHDGLAVTTSSRPSNRAESPLADSLSRETPDVEMDETTTEAASNPGAPEPPPHQTTRTRYKGRRTAAGKDMPDQFRGDMVKGFVHGVFLAFGAQVVPPRNAPHLQINRLNIPVRQTAAVYRVPRDRQRARGGFLQGPLLTVQCRPDIDFYGDNLSTKRRETKSRLDAMRELGGLLQLGQERQRQGKTQEQPNEGAWWTTVPRWGGGSGKAVATDEKANNGEPEQHVLQMTEDAMAGDAARKDSAKRHRANLRLWKKLQPNRQMTWDSKVEFEPIGKEPDSDYDELFMVSSLNHHISILKMTAHVAYIEYVRKETLPTPLPDDDDWCRPKLQRTRWYNLLDADDRVEALTALWGIAEYLFRCTVMPFDSAKTGEAAPGAAESS